MQVAGVEDEPPAAAERAPSGQSQWAQQLEKNYAAAGSTGSGGGGGRSSSARDPNTMVKIVGYNQEPTAPQARPSASSYDVADHSTGSSFGYDNIAGVHLLGVAVQYYNQLHRKMPQEGSSPLKRRSMGMLVRYSSNLSNH